MWNIFMCIYTCIYIMLWQYEKPVALLQDNIEYIHDRVVLAVPMCTSVSGLKYFS